MNSLVICLAYARDGHVYAFDDACTHEGISLSDGELLGFEVECPGHNSRFDVRTGAVKGLPATKSLRTFPVVIKHGVVNIEMEGSTGNSSH